MGPDTFAWVFDCFRIGLIVVPSILLFAITILLIRTIKTSDAPKLNVNRHKRVSSAFRNTTVMLTVIIVLFLLARVPSTLSDLLPLGSLEFAHSAYLRAFANIILVTLHPISFAVYMFMSRRFRVSLRRLLGWRFLASDEEFNAVNSSVRTSQFKSQQSPHELYYPAWLTAAMVCFFFTCGQTSVSRFSRPSMSKKGVVFAPSTCSISSGGPTATNKSLSEWSTKSNFSTRFALFARRFRFTKRCDTV
ncbi:hypothetical protein OSTOST_20930 [Ostertagia ostertagi]